MGDYSMAPSSIADMVGALTSKDSKEKLKGFADAEAYLNEEEVDTDGAPALVDALLPSLSENNPKYVQGALSLLIALVEVMGEDLAPCIAGVWAPLAERLGDAKAANRERAVDLSVALATLVVPPAQALDRLKPAWEHKNWRARESALLWFGRLLASHEPNAGLGIPLKSMLGMVAKVHARARRRRAAAVATRAARGGGARRRASGRAARGQP